MSNHRFVTVALYSQYDYENCGLPSAEHQVEITKESSWTNQVWNTLNNLSTKASTDLSWCAEFDLENLDGFVIQVLVDKETN